MEAMNELTNLAAYGIYNEALEKGSVTVFTKDIDATNLNIHFDNIVNILSDGIETPAVQKTMIHVVFVDGEDVDLTIFDYLFNLIFWSLSVNVGENITSDKFFFAQDLTRKVIRNYIDNVFVRRYRTTIPFKALNNIIDDVFGKFRTIRKFQMFLANTLCLEDTIDLMNKYPEFNETLHLDLSGVPIEDVKDVGMQATNTQIEYIKNSDHCLRDSFRAQEAISPKQYKEVQVSIGSKPDGQGGVFPMIINNSFINGGLQDPESVCIESSVGRIAQILTKTNVGSSGAFARILGLNNIDTRLHDDPHYSCNTKHFERVFIKNSTILKLYDMRYYRVKRNGIDKLLNAVTDTHLIGETLYFRSPMTCASKAQGKGICYKCYGDLAYINRDINIGKIAAELLSAIYTQTLLSAKHLLESLVVKMNWVGPFKELFDLNFNTIQLKEDLDYKGYSLIIQDEPMTEEDESFDELDYNCYLNSILIKDPNGEILNIHTSESENIYIHSDLLEKVSKIIAKAADTDDIVEIPLDSLKNIPILFVMKLKNNELSATMDKVKRIINTKAEVSKYDKDSILEAFMSANLDGGINLNAIHFEILLSNQIRDGEDIIENPDWEREDASYQIIPLSSALSNNQSITTRLNYSKLSKTLYTPSSFKVRKPSNIDLFFMEKPQEFIYNDKIITEGDALINDIDQTNTVAIHFDTEETDK